MMDADLAVSLADGSFEAFSPRCCSQQLDSKSSNLAVGNLALKDNPKEDETIPGIADSSCANHGNDDSLHCDGRNAKHQDSNQANNDSSPDEEESIADLDDCMDY